MIPFIESIARSARRCRQIRPYLKQRAATSDSLFRHDDSNRCSIAAGECRAGIPQRPDLHADAGSTGEADGRKPVRPLSGWPAQGSRCHYSRKNPQRRLSIAAWWSVLPGKGYKWQLAGASLKIMHPDKKLIGRAVTAQFLPMRPDLAKVANPDSGGPHISPPPTCADRQSAARRRARGRPVPGRVEGGTIVGDNCTATAIWNATHTWAWVVWMARYGIWRESFPSICRSTIAAFTPSALDYTAGGLADRIGVPVKNPAMRRSCRAMWCYGDRGGLYFIPRR